MLGDLIAAEGVEPGSVVPLGNRSEVGAPWGLYRCAGEEEWLAITCRDDADWQGLVAAMGSPDVGDRRRLRRRGGSARRRPTRSTPASASGPRRDRRTRSAHACQAQGVPAAPMLTGAEMTTDAQYVARGFAVQIDQPGVGPLVLDGAAFRGARMAGPDIAARPRSRRAHAPDRSRAVGARRRRDRPAPRRGRVGDDAAGRLSATTPSRHRATESGRVLSTGLQEDVWRRTSRPQPMVGAEVG